jgi:glucose/arabinose dehydrogenase
VLLISKDKMKVLMNLFGLFCIIFCLCLLVSNLILFPGYAFSAQQAGFNETAGENKNGSDGMPKIDNENVAIAGSEREPNKTSGRANNESGVISYGLSSYWTDPNSSCKGTFKCSPYVTSISSDNASFRISTTNNTKNTWSWIYGQPIDVKLNENYKVVTHMKLGKWAKGSHAVIEGFNETSNKWDQITQCPSRIDGPLEWLEFNCDITIHENTTKIRPVLNAGWSSLTGKEATTWFDSVYIVKLGQDIFKPNTIADTPTVIDPKLKVEVVFNGLEFPTSMTFLGPNDILVLEKNNGTVQRIVNGNLLPKPLLDVNVANRNERGMLGIDIAKHNDKNGRATNVFLYYTESETKDGSDVDENKQPLGNRVYRYELAGDRLINPKLLLDLPVGPGYAHNGGKILIGPDHNLYVPIGDLWGGNTTTENIKNTSKVDGRSGILRVTQDGQPVANGILGTSFPLNLYYGYGIRNSFGLAFDPLTKTLWDTENGDTYGDEINHVNPGFNSGWRKIQGFWEGWKRMALPIMSDPAKDMVDFRGKGKYSEPEFSWKMPVGVTAVSFLNSSALGELYENDLFVASFHRGEVYHFDLNEDRTKLVLNNLLIDNKADTMEELDPVTFGNGLGGITDMKLGPDGYLYILTIRQGGVDCLETKSKVCLGYNSGIEGMIFRIVPANSK